MLSRILALLFGLCLIQCSTLANADDLDEDCQEELQAIIGELIDFIDQPAFRAFVARLSADERTGLITALAEVLEGVFVAFDAECGPRFGDSSPSGLRRVHIRLQASFGGQKGMLVVGDLCPGARTEPGRQGVRSPWT